MCESSTVCSRRQRKPNVFFTGVETADASTAFQMSLNETPPTKAGGFIHSPPFSSLAFDAFVTGV